MKSVKKEVSFRRKLMTAVLSVTLPLIALLLFSNLYSTQAFNRKDSNIFESARFCEPSRVLAGLIYYSITTFGESLDMRRSTRDAREDDSQTSTWSAGSRLFDGGGRSAL